MLTWISRIMVFVFLLNIVTPELVYAQRYSSNSSGNPSPTKYSLPTYQLQVQAPSRGQLQKRVENQVNNASQRSISMASSEEEADKLYSMYMLPLLDQYDEMNVTNNYAELADVVENIHNLVNEYKLWYKAHQMPEPAVAESTAYHIKGKASWEQVLQVMDGEEGDTLDLVEAVDPLSPGDTEAAKNNQAMQTAYAAEVLLQALDSTTPAEVTELRDFLPRLHARATYRLKHTAPIGISNIMSRGALRMLLRETSDLCAEAKGNCPRVDYLQSFLKRVGELKDDPDNSDDLNLELQYAVRYTVFNLRAPEELAAFVVLLEEKPGRRPTRFETKHSDALGTLMYALVDAVAQTPQDKQTVEKAQKFLVNMAGPAHATDTRVFAIAAAARLNRFPLPRKPHPFTDEQRQQLVSYAVDLYHPLNESGLNGARETYGLKSEGMKKLADDLVSSMRGLVPVTGAASVYQQGRYAPGQETSISILEERRAMTESGRQVEIPTFLYGSNGRIYSVYVYNGINAAQQEKEYTLKFWSEAFTWIFFGEVLKAGFMAFKLVGRALKIAPRALEAAKVASKGKKLGRFTTKMRQGIKYGTNASGTGKVAATTAKVESTASKTTGSTKTAQRPSNHARNVNGRSAQQTGRGVTPSNAARPNNAPAARQPQARNVPRSEPIPNLPKAKGSDGGIALSARKTPTTLQQQQAVTGPLESRVEAVRASAPVETPAPAATEPVQKSAGQKVTEWLQDYFTALRRPSGVLQAGIPGIPAPGSFKAVRAERAMREAAEISARAGQVGDAGIRIRSVTVDGTKVTLGQKTA